MGRNASIELDMALLSALEHQKAADVVAAKEEIKAFKMYEQLAKRGMVGNAMTFKQWVASGNVPAYWIALDNQQAREAAVTNIQYHINGELAAELNKAKQAIRNGLDGETELDGYVFLLRLVSFLQ